MIAFEHKDEGKPPPAAKKPPAAAEEKPLKERRKVSIPVPRSEDWRKPEEGPGPAKRKP